MATREQIGRALINADKAGDTEAARRLAAAYKNYEESTAPSGPAFTPEGLAEAQQDMNVDIGGLEAGMIAAGRGLTTLGRGLGLVEDEDPAVTESYKGLQEQHPVGTTVGEIAGEAAPFMIPGTAVAKIPALWARIVASTTIGATEGGLITSGKGDNAAMGAAVGGITAGTLEAVLPSVIRRGTQLIRRIRGKSPTGSVVDKKGVPSAEFQEALADSGQTIDDIAEEVLSEFEGKALDPKQAARQAFLESQGIKPTTAQVTRTADDFQAQQELAKTSTGVRAALEQQEAALTSRFNTAIEKTGGEGQPIGSPVTDVIVSKATQLDNTIGDLYKTAREAAATEKIVRFDGLEKKVRELAPSNRRAGGNVEAFVGDMQAKGILDKDMKVVGKVDVETAEDLRELANELYDPANPFGNSILRKLKDSLDDDVFKAVGEDAFKESRAAKATFERDLSRAGVSKFDSRKANLVRDVLENKISPDSFVKDTIMSKKWRAADIEQLKKYVLAEVPAIPGEGKPAWRAPNVRELEKSLQEGTASKGLEGAPLWMTSNIDDFEKGILSASEVSVSPGQAAWNSLRAETLESIKERSFFGPEDADGFRALSRDKLQKAIQSIGTPKLKVLFTPKELKFLKDLLEVTKLREPVRGTALGKGPSAQAIGVLQRAIESIPIVGSLLDDVTVGVGGKIVLRGKAASAKVPGKEFNLSAATPIAAAATVPEENQ